VWNKSLPLKEQIAKQLLENKERFYPDTIARHQDEPTTDKFRIISDPAYGEGVITKVPFHMGELLFHFQGRALNYQSLFTLQKRPGLYIEDPFFMGKILHSCDPNAYVDMETQLFRARRTIKPGEFITMDYESTEDELFRSFYCQCGSYNCRGYIAGRLCRVNDSSNLISIAK
jgi:tyrocidine synthetase-3